MKIKVTLEGDREFKRQLKQFAKAINGNVEDSIVEYAISGGRSLAMQTEPYGLGKKAKEQAEGAAERDVNKVYKNVGRVHNEIAKISKRKAAAYLKAVNAGDNIAAEKIARNAIKIQSVKFDGGKLHNSQRDKRGRVKEGNKSANPLSLSSLFRYRDKQAAKAGTAKSGWVDAVLDLKGKKPRFPKWINKKQNLGKGKIKRRGFKTEVTLTNKVGYITNLLRPSRIKKALARNNKNFAKRMNKTIAAFNAKR